MMNETRVLLDGATGLHVAWYFWLRVLDEVNRSARYGAPFGLVLLEAADSDPRSAKRVENAASHVSAAVRSTDLAGLISPGRVGILLTEQDGESAGLAMRRVLERIGDSAARVGGWRPTLLAYPNDGAEISNLLTRGWIGTVPGDAAESA